MRHEYGCSSPSARLGVIRIANVNKFDLEVMAVLQFKENAVQDASGRSDMPYIDTTKEFHDVTSSYAVQGGWQQVHTWALRAGPVETKHHLKKQEACEKDYWRSWHSLLPLRLR